MSDVIHVVCPHCHATNRLPAEKLNQSGKCGKCHKPLFTSEPITLTAQNFDKHIQKSDLPVVVDFWASWCGPCKMMAPVFAQAAAQLEPRFRLVKVSTETEQNLAAQYRIQSIPTLAIFHHGREMDRMAGALDLGSLIRWVEQPR